MLFNGENEYFLHLARGVQEAYQHDRACSRISKEEVRRMKSGKAIGLDLIVMEIWKCLGKEGLEWLMELFNAIFRTIKMPSECRTSTIIPLYKNQGDI